MGTKWTKEQESAISTMGCNLLVAAAAGSGKTAVLVERIIRMITDDENPIDIDKLLVVTFTSAAASEMRERIGEAISKKLDENPHSKILQRQLTLLNRSNITTMHSFCLDIIKNNFHQIDLDPNFRIGDETEMTLMKGEILDDIFESKYENISSNGEFYKVVEAFSGVRDDKKLKELVENIYTFSMSGASPKRWLIDNAEEFNIHDDFDMTKSSWIKILMDGCDDDIKSLINLCKELIDTCSGEGLDKPLIYMDEVYTMLNTCYNAFNEGYEAFYNAINGVKFGRLTFPKDTDEDLKKSIQSGNDTIKKSLKEIQSSMGFNLSEAKYTIKEMYPIIKGLVNLVIEFMDEFEKTKREKGIVDFNDLEHLTLRILNDGYKEGELRPSSIAVDLREKFAQVLVDEYQDSNNVQETLINLVSRKFVDNPNVFMVGDVKQSIYRFRQAKPELFLDKYNSYPAEDGSRNKKILLYKNFRSRDEVINCVNYIFKKVMSKTVGELQYDDKEVLNLGASYPPLEDNDEGVTGGASEVYIIDLDAESVEENDEEIETEEEELDKIQVEAIFVTKKIKSILNETGPDKLKVFDKNINGYRDVTYKDIVILLRATSNWADIFVEEMSKEDIPAYADASNGYFQTIEIKTIMSLLQIIDNPLQDIPMLAVLRSPIFAFTPEELIDLRVYNRGRYFYEILKDIAEDNNSLNQLDSGYELEEELVQKARRVVESVEKWRKKSIHTPIDEFIWYLYMDTSYYGYVRAMPNGVQRQANLRILFQRAKQYEKTSFKGLFNFINFINKIRSNNGDLGSAKTLGENENVVRIMSIHKSKGLEFPVVVLAGCGKKFNQRDLNETILYHEELGFGPDYIDYENKYKFSTIAKQAIKKKIKMENLSEEMRVLYVAFTRAKEKLIITGSTRGLEKRLGRWAAAVGSTNDVVTGSEVAKGTSYLDWIGMSLMMHSSGTILRNQSGRGDIHVTINDEDSKWDINIINKSNIVDHINKAILEESGHNEFINSIEEVAFEKEVDRRLSWKYKYELSSKITANISVSELKKSSLPEENESVHLIKEPTIRKPEFLQEKKGLSNTEKGTAVHSVMELLDLRKVDSIEKIKAQLLAISVKEVLTKEEIQAVNPQKIYNFFSSDIGQRLLKCYKESPNNVYRETPFYINIKSSYIEDVRNNENYSDVYENEMVRLQGVIDCFFEEEGELILVDYKTDYVGDNGIEEIKNKYKKQVELYSEALNQITGKNIREKYLYLFYNGELIEM